MALVTILTLPADIFGKYLKDPSNFFVLSSDFCHWGQRFQYTPYDKECGEIWQSIVRQAGGGGAHGLRNPWIGRE